MIIGPGGYAAGYGGGTGRASVWGEADPSGDMGALGGHQYGGR